MLISKFLYPTKTIYTVHSYLIDHYLPNSSFLTRLMYQNSYKVVAITHKTKELIEQKHELSNVQTIFNPVNKKTNTGDLVLAKNVGFSGKIGLTRYYGRVLSPQEAWDIYKTGPTTNLLGTLLNRYNASFTFYQDNEEVQKIFIM